MPKEEAQVEEGKAGVPQAGTPEPNEVAKSTLVQPAVDVEKLQRDYDAKLSQAQRDLDKMKSSLQSQAAKQEAEYRKQVESLRQELRDARKQGMTDEQRAEYEEHLQAEELSRLQSQLEEAEMTKKQMASYMEAWKFFVAQGVPHDKLVTDEGYDALVRSGWEHINAERDALKQEIAALKTSKSEPKKDEPAPLPDAPAVVTDKGQPGGGTTWDALRKKFGSDENVYRAVEEGKLNPSIIPLDE